MVSSADRSAYDNLYNHGLAGSCSHFCMSVLRNAGDGAADKEAEPAKPDGTHIRDLCFKGIEAGHNPEIGYGILDEFQGQGYATEAVKLALKWAFEHPQVLAVEAESDPDNAASQRVLEKCGFLATGAIGEEGPRFIVYKGANRPVDDCSAPTGVERRNNKQ